MIKKLLLTTLVAVVAVLTGCEQSQNVYSNGFKFTRVDISGAKYLSIADGGSGTKAANEGSPSLFKIDDKGNMTGVTFYCEPIYDKNGNQTGETDASTDFAVCPKFVTDYGEKYLLFTECYIKPLDAKFLTAEGWYTDEFSTVLRNSGYDNSPHFLISKIDGAIFFVSEEDIKKFPRNSAYREPWTDAEFHYKLQYNAAGDLYMADGVLSKLKIENDKMLLQTLTQPDIRVEYMMLDKYSNVYTHDGYNTQLKYGCLPAGKNLYFANGSVMKVPEFEAVYDRRSTVIFIDNELYAIKRGVFYMDDAYNEPWELRKLPNQLPANPSNPSFDLIATITPKSQSFDANTFGIYNSPTQAVIFGFLVYDKATKSLSERNVPEEFVIGRMSGSDDGYNENGIAYQMQNNNAQIARYNIFDLTKQIVECDRAAVPPFVVSKTKQTSTEFIEYGIKSIDGTPIRVHTELQTGRVKVFEDTDKRTIVELIRVS